MARMNHEKAAKKFLSWRRSRGLPNNDVERSASGGLVPTPRGDKLAVDAARAERQWLRRLPDELRQALDPTYQRRGKPRR